MDRWTTGISFTGFGALNPSRTRPVCERPLGDSRKFPGPGDRVWIERMNEELFQQGEMPCRMAAESVGVECIFDDWIETKRMRWQGFRGSPIFA